MATEEQDRIDQIMSKRDEIAGMCMASMMAKQLDVMASNPTGVISGIAFMSIKAADMLVSALIATPYQKPNTESQLKF